MGSFTAKRIQSLVREAKPGRYGDGNGLYLMIPKAGAAYWMCRYTFAGKRRGMTLGKYPHLSLAEAREQVVETQRAIRNGTDPLTERKREEKISISTVQDLFDDWYQDLEKRLKHPKIPKRLFERDIAPAIGSLTLDSVTPMDVRAIVRKVTSSGRPTIANDALMYLKQLFNHSIKLGLLTYNPASAFNVNDAGGVEKSRDRALSIDELSKAFTVFRENRTSFTRDNYLACALLVVLGVRKTELTEAKWSEFDLNDANWDLPGERSKSGVGIAIPLPPQAIAWLEELKIRAFGSPYVFPSRRSSKQPHMGKDTLNRAIAKLFGKEPGKKQQPKNKMGDLAEFTVHDLRRTCRSLLAAAGVPGHVAERCLNHKLKGVEGIYDRYDYYEERKQALIKVAELVEPSINDKEI
ncbi:integrase arm-type DNA-binding domain-containing protein [Halomonas sp. 7T]|uniref:tyrosine-type recombinase/integrase n=1 Tax=unclassified Halomonas TaxID=2609666 RepID=UPI0009F6AE9F|nr:MULTISPECIES: site-specific integrase [unclassified Halomonas]UXZ53952.1 integrase arm-type DNA-binding domain-containing protein [Halomonas sp. 7T]